MKMYHGRGERCLTRFVIYITLPNIFLVDKKVML